MLNALICLLGMAVLVGVAFAFSVERGAINWRTVSLALLLQLLFGAVVLYDPDSQSFAQSSNTLSHRRRDHTASRLPDGTVLILGGRSYDWSGTEYAFSYHSSAELYEPASDSFVVLPAAMSTPRVGWAAINTRGSRASSRPKIRF